jgi:hypothetical protein
MVSLICGILNCIHGVITGENIKHFLPFFLGEGLVVSLRSVVYHLQFLWWASQSLLLRETYVFVRYAIDITNWTRNLGTSSIQTNGSTRA